MAGAYRATPIATLETETYTPPLDLYLDSRVAAFQTRLQESPVYQQIQKACQVIVRRTRVKARQRDKYRTSGEARKEWAAARDQAIGGDQVSRKAKLLRAWETRWNTLPRTTWDQIKRPPEKRVLQLHAKLQKAESSMLVQLRSGRTGLAHFLCKARVPSYDTGQCECGQSQETPRHVLLHCPREADRRVELGQGPTFVRLLDTPDGAAVASRWMIQSGRLRQFQVVNSLSYV